jgi:hypothetical protein
LPKGDSLAEKHGIQIVNEGGLTKMLEQTDARFDPDMLSIFDRLPEILSEVRE